MATARKSQDVWDVEETEESEAEERDVITYQISYYPADLTLRGYLDKWNSNTLVIPPFQRNYVWDQVQASKLIESFLLGLPVPGVFLYKERLSNRLQIIDGQQRISTAVNYFKNLFGEKKFRLKNVHPKWEGKTYDELEEQERLLLDDTVLRATVVQQLDPGDDSSIYHIFERLNTGGTRLNTMEVRKCVYFGSYFSLLEDLNSYESWRNILGQKRVDSRLRDVELILRILALADGWKNYEKPMKQFLNQFIAVKRKSEANARANSTLLKATRKKFETACDSIATNLGEKPFHLRGRLNYAALDSVFSAVINAKSQVKNFAKKWNTVKQNTDFIEYVTKNTSDEVAVKKRFAIAASVIKA